MVENKLIGTLIGNTGDPNDLKIALKDSFVARRGEFVRIKHQERKSEREIDVLGRIVSISRNNILYNSDMGEGLNDLEMLPGAQITGENLYMEQLN